MKSKISAQRYGFSYCNVETCQQSPLSLKLLALFEDIDGGNHIELKSIGTFTLTVVISIQL